MLGPLLAAPPPEAEAARDEELRARAWIVSYQLITDGCRSGLPFDAASSRPPSLIMWIGGAGSDDEEDENDEYYTDTFDDVDAATNAAFAESLREMDAESTAAAAPPVQAPTASTAADPVAPPIHRAAADPAVPPLHEIGSVRSAVPRSPGPSPGPIRIWGVECRPISSIPGMAPGEARARGATRRCWTAARSIG